MLNIKFYAKGHNKPVLLDLGSFYIRKKTIGIQIEIGFFKLKIEIFFYGTIFINFKNKISICSIFAL